MPDEQTLRRMLRSVVFTQIGLERLLAHYGLEPVTEAEVDAALAEVKIDLPASLADIERRAASMEIDKLAATEYGHWLDEIGAYLALAKAHPALRDAVRSRLVKRWDRAALVEAVRELSPGSPVVAKAAKQTLVDLLLGAR